MKKKAFKNLLEEVCLELFGYNITKYEKRYFWKKVRRIPQEIKENPEKAFGIAEIVDYSPRELGRFRHVLAMRGTEMTPRQIDIYIMALDIVLSDVGFYEWETI